MQHQTEDLRVKKHPDGKIHLLLVEDDDTIRHMLTYGLRAAGYHVEVAGNGAEAMDVLKTFEPDLIILDLYMPKMDGLAFLKQYESKVPILVCSGSDEEQDIRRTLETGASRFLQKPVTLNALQEAIQTLL
ncbi:Response regulator [Sulfidibacter corallicola]|uniref:Response regulator n=1 Tax=Sulfidibacter corallicola TaxID=2818388 RepID=A0A8A4TY65_SULCO|nr:response regulator [Sulfidibacter corallicola]QTD53902.1 response regulator [Sulfidibacter corallicola]